jgi:snRNA-activating protein complex subunit 1
MLEKNMFLFGFVDLHKGSISETVKQLTELQDAHMQVAYKKYVS